MSLIFGWPVKAHADLIARERAGVAADSQQRRPRRRVLRAGLCALLIAASLLAAPARAQNATATVPVGNSPNAIAVNPVTNKIYIANAQGSGGVTIMDGATNVTSTLTDMSATGLFAVAVNPVTNVVYVTNQGSNNISVFNGATALSAGQFVATVADGSGTGPGAVAVNPVTNMVYVCNSTAGTVVVIGGSTNTILFTIHVGNSPQAIAINPATDLIYVVNQGDNTVSVINGATNTVANLGANPNPIPVDSHPTSIGVNPATNKIYVANSVGDDISVIDGSSNTVTATLQDGLASNPYAVAVNPVTNQIFVANLFGNTTVINGFSNGITDVGTAAGSAIVVDTATNTAYVADRDANAVTAINGFSYATTVVPTQPSAEAIEIAVNPVTHKIYAANFNSAGTVTVIDGATNTVQPLTPPNQGPAVVAVNPVTNLIYVANSVSNNVSVIDGSTNALLRTVQVDPKPAAIVVDPVNNLVYVANHDGGDITVIDSQFDTSTITFNQAITPDELAFNPVLNIVYGASSQASGLAFQFFSQDGPQTINPNTLFVGTDITAVAVNPAQGYNVYVVATVPGAMAPTPGIQVFDSHGGFTTSTCDAPAIPDAMDVNATTNTIYIACSDGSIDIYQQPDSFNPGNLLTLVPGPGRGAAVAVNAVTNMAYVADSGSSNVYVIPGASPAIVTIPVINPVAIAVNVATNKIYVVSQGNQSNTPNVTIIDGATNTILGAIALTGPGSLTEEIAVNPATGNIYALDSAANAIDVTTENAVEPNALQTTIFPLPSIGGLPPNSTNTTAPTFTFSATNGLTTGPVTGVYYQVDTQQGQWTAAIPSGNVFTGVASGITPGFHILYAYATDGEDGAAGNSGAFSAQNGPLVGALASCGFLVSPPIATINFYPLDFGSVPVGGVSNNPEPIIINEGGSPMTYSYTITGPNASEFIVDPNQSSCATSGTLSANSLCGIFVTFQPTTTGPATATLTWTDNSLAISNSIQSIGFTGNGLAPTGSVFTGLTGSQSILVGTSSINLSGTISAGGNFPPSGERVAITINSITENATIGVNGVFSMVFATSSIPASATPYPITYNYAGDGSFSAASNSSTTLTVDSSTPGVTATMTLLGTGTGFVIDGQNLNCSETAGVTSGTCSGYTVNSLVTFTANPTAPTTFGGWGGACASFGTSATCNLTMISSQNVTANFIPPPTTVALTFPVGANPPPQEAVFACPSNTNPCMDPSAHALQLTIPNVSSTVNVTVLATEVPPSQADGLCESGNSVTNDFDCRFVTFFSDGTDANNNTIVPLCDPYANGNCVHYLVYSTAGGPGVEPPPSSYSGGVYWQITWNNESFTPPAPNYLGSTPQLYDDPDYPVSQTTPYGTNCSPSTPMLVGITNPQDTNPLIYCQFEFNITQFYNPTQTVDSGIGGSTKQFNDVVVAFPPTVAGTNPVVQPPTPTIPTVALACLTGCSITGTTINFTVGTGGTFQAVPTGYPASTLTESGALPNGLTINNLTGIVGGTPAPGTDGNFPISFTATNSTGHVTQGYTIAVSSPAPPPNFTVTVTELGTGTGQVTDGINLDCMEANGITTGTCSGTYAGGSMVTFTANPTASTTFGGWGGACASSGASLACTLTISSSQNVTANFVPPPTSVALTFPVGTNPPPQEAVFNCPSNTNPCMDPSAHALQLTIPNVSSTVNVTVLATEVPPSQANGLCGSGNTVLNDFDCRFVTFFSDGTDANNNKIVPLCDPYANGNCVHYLVYSGTPGTEPDPSSYSGGVYWQITWNNESFTPPAPYYLGSTPQLYDDPDYAPTPGSSVGTSCTQPMTINGANQSYSCQFEFNITEFYDPTQTVDSGIGGSTKQFNDVVVAFPPTVAGTNPIVQPPTPSTPAITATCLTGCSISASIINFSVGTGGTFQVVPTGYPAPKLTESGALPSGLTMNKLTGILGGTPAPGTSGIFPITFTATNSTGTATKNFTLTVDNTVPTITTLSPTSAAVGAAAQTLTINGTNFLSASAVTYNGVAHTATFVSAVKLTIQLTTGDQATAGAFPVIVTNPMPGGGASSPVSFTVNNLAPTISTLSPTSATAGAAAQTLTINGTNFVSTSTVTYNGVAHTPTFANAVKLTIQLTTGDQATAGTFPVVVANPMPGGGASGPVSFTVNNLVPTITTLSPASATAGAAAQTLTINGTNFVSTSTVTYNGVAHTATFVSAVKLTIQLTTGDQATGGSFPVKVTNPAPGGGASNSVNFTVNQPPVITSANTTTFTVGTAGNFTVTASGFPAPTFSETGALPSNVTLSLAGVLSGTPAANTGGTYKITITASNGISPNATQSFTLIVTSGATLKIAPTSVNFGTVHLDQIGAQFVTLTNTGTTPITISSIKITAPGNALGDFGEITICSPFIPSMPGTLAAGKTCTIAVGFLASAKIFSPTVSTATITINDNAAGSPQLIPLSLTVINPQASLSVTSLSFATQKVGTTSAAKTVTLTNTGNTPLTLGTLTTTGNFALVSGSGTTCSNNGTVAAGASCAINVTFKPTAKGNNTGGVKITDNALSSPQSISLSGTGN